MREEGYGVGVREVRDERCGVQVRDEGEGFSDEEGKAWEKY